MSNDERKVFDAITLTAAYTGNESVDMEVRSNDKYSILAIYDKGAAETSNTCEIEVSFTPDGTEYAQTGFWSAAATSTFTAQTYQFAQDTNVPIDFEAMGRSMRIRVKETGVASNFGTLTLYLYRGKS